MVKYSCEPGDEYPCCLGDRTTLCLPGDPHALRATGPRGPQTTALLGQCFISLRPQGAPTFSVKQQTASEHLAEVALHCCARPLPTAGQPGLRDTRLLPHVITREWACSHTQTWERKSHICGEQGTLGPVSPSRGGREEARVLTCCGEAWRIPSLQWQGRLLSSGGPLCPHLLGTQYTPSPAR